MILESDTNEKAKKEIHYSGSGIYRPVSLYTAGSSYIKPEGIKVQVLDQECIFLRLACVAENAQAKITILDQNAVVTDMVVEDLTHLETEGITIMIPNAKPWSAEDPHLYRVRAELVQDGSVLDCDESHFGMRTLAWGKEGFLVNGKEVLFRGACIHHDNGVLGACGFADAETRRVRILKEAGFNAIRSAHNPISKAMLDACDVMGMYVMDETFDMWLIHKNPYDYAGDKFKEWWKADTEAMISKDYNHPSVVMYSIGNEITELGMDDGDFPTVSYPNPEAKEAFTLGLALAKKVDADLVLATDPDADRLGVYVKDAKTGEYHPFFISFILPFHKSQPLGLTLSLFISPIY